MDHGGRIGAVMGLFQNEFVQQSDHGGFGRMNLNEYGWTGLMIVLPAAVR